jgi:hypothetical protein
MKLQPRHSRLIDYLSTHSPEAFSIPELSLKLNLASKVISNEIPKLVDLGYVRRKPVGRSFEYYIAKTPSKYLANATPVEPITDPVTFVTRFLLPITQPDYIPILTKLDWTMPTVVAQLTSAGVTSNLNNSQLPAKQALEAFLETIETTALACRSLLATAALWDERLPQWLTGTLSEIQLENLEELARQATAKYARLKPSTESEPLEQD